MNAIKKVQDSTVLRAFHLLPKSDRIRIIAVISIQILMSGIDLIAVALIGILGSLTVSGISSRTPGTRVGQVLEILNIDSKPFQYQAAIIGIIAVTMLLSRTVLSISFSKRTLRFLALRSARITSELFSKLLTQPLLVVQQKTSQETLYALTTGVSNIALGIIGTTVSVVSDFALILVLSVGLFILDPVISIVTILVFSLVGYLLYKLLHSKAFQLGNNQASIEIASNEGILEVLSTYREAIVRNRRHYYANLITQQRTNLAEIQAELSFMPNISKYVVETTVVIGSLILSAIQFLTHDASHAIASLAIFMAAGMRIAPAAMRLQQGAIQVRITVGISATTFDMIERLQSIEVTQTDSKGPDFKHSGFNANINLDNVSLTYPSNSEPTIKSLSLRIELGEVVALVGPSGAGKSTLVDLMLGILPCDSGQITISGQSPEIALRKWPGAIAYVPQEVVIVNKTLKENVTLGYEFEGRFIEHVQSALKVAQLADFVKLLPEGLDSKLGERGSKMSGGQRQRLGIARALFTEPKLLVLDEATSALDGQTEAAVTSSINALRGSTTVVLIAHRLTTVMAADKVVYLENGQIRAIGTFDEVRRSVPEFDKQASLISG